MSPPRIRRRFNSTSARLARAAERVVQNLDDVANLGAGQRIVDVLAVPPGLDETIRAQPSQLLRNGGLPQLEHLLDLGHRPLALDEKTEDEQPHLVRERLEEFARLARVGEHEVDVESCRKL